VFELQPRSVYHWSKLSEMKNQIISSLSSQTICNTGEVLYKSQGNYSCRHTVPVSSLDKKRKYFDFFHVCAVYFFLLIFDTFKSIKKIKIEPWYPINVAKHEDGNSAVFFLKSISYVILTKFGSVNAQWNFSSKYHSTSYQTIRLSNAQDQCTIQKAPIYVVLYAF